LWLALLMAANKKHSKNFGGTFGMGLEEHDPSAGKKFGSSIMKNKCRQNDGGPK